MCFAICAHAGDPLGRESAQSSVIGFLQACHAHDNQRASRYLDLSRLGRTDRLREGAELAAQLGRILDSDTHFDEAAVSAEGAAAGPQLIASIPASGKNYELKMERQTLRSGVAVWVFSPDTVAAIPALARLTSDSPMEKYVPPSLAGWKLIGTPVWRWGLLALAAIVALALSRIVCVLTVWLTRTRLTYLSRLLGPVRLMLATVLFRVAVAWIGPSARLHKYLDNLVSLVFFGALAWLAMRALDFGVERASGVLKQHQHTFAYSVLPLAGRVSKVVIGVLAGITILSSWGYNTTAILAGLGVGGVAFALAAQKTIENLFGGVSVITDRPVVVGEFCKFGDRSGTVEDIGLRSTRIRTPERTLITVPNGNFSSMTLENFSRKDKTWFHLMLNLRRDTSAEQVRQLLDTLSRIVNETPKIERTARPVHFAGVGTYSLDLDIGAYFTTTDDEALAPIQEDLYLRILDAVAEAGTSLALPTQAYYSIGRSGGHNGKPVAHDALPGRR